MLLNIFTKVLGMSLTAGFVIAVVLLARLLLRRSPKIFSYALWSVVLLRLLALFLFHLLFPSFPAVSVTRFWMCGGKRLIL